MKFLIDRCAGHRLAVYLAEIGHDVLESKTLGHDPGDAALLALAASQGRVLVTIDTDFGKLVYVDKLPHRGVVRLPDVPSRQRIQLMKVVFERHTQDMEAGAIITVRGNKIRVSRL